MATGRKRVSAYVSDDLDVEIERLCVASGLSRSAVIQWLLYLGLRVVEGGLVDKPPKE